MIIKGENALVKLKREYDNGKRARAETKTTNLVYPSASDVGLNQSLNNYCGIIRILDRALV